MDIISVMNDKALKGTKKRAAIIELIVSGNLNCEQIEAINTEINDKQMASILEAIEEISNKGLSQLSSRYLLFAIPYIKSENNNCRREASRIVGNMAAQYPDMIEEAISPLLDNSSNEGTVIRWAAAYALSRIITTDRYAQSKLYDKLTDISNKEEDNAIRNQYLKALKKASKVRK